MILITNEQLVSIYITYSRTILICCFRAIIFITMKQKHIGQRLRCYKFSTEERKSNLN
jgi:hypothetical protein